MPIVADNCEAAQHPILTVFVDNVFNDHLIGEGGQYSLVFAHLKINGVHHLPVFFFPAEGVVRQGGAVSVVGNALQGEYDMIDLVEAVAVEPLVKSRETFWQFFFCNRFVFWLVFASEKQGQEYRKNVFHKYMAVVVSACWGFDKGGALRPPPELRVKVKTKRPRR